MTLHLRLTGKLFERLHDDLSRRHQHSAERVAFMSCLAATMKDGTLALLGAGFHPVADDDYERDPSVGAMLRASAFRNVLQIAYNCPVSMLHVHRHEHRGMPWFSDVDLREAHKYVPDFWKVRPGFPHGILVLSHDSAAGLIWMPDSGVPSRLRRISLVGAPMREIRHDK